MLFRRSRRLEVEIENNRLTKDELSSLEQDQLRKEAEERKMRSEKARTKMEELKQKEIENVNTIIIIIASWLLLIFILLV